MFIFVFTGMAVEIDNLNTSITNVPDSLPLMGNEANSFWTFNESADVSKYENFDHSKFIGKLNILKISITKGSWHVDVLYLEGTQSFQFLITCQLQHYTSMLVLRGT